MLTTAVPPVATTERVIAPPWWVVALLALPVWLLPFERAFMFPLLAYLIFGLMSLRQWPQWLRQSPPFQALTGIFLAIWLPVVISGIDSIDPAQTWKTAGYFLVFFIAACGVYSLFQRYAGVAWRLMILLAAISLFWLIDGLIQNLAGVDLFGVPLARPIAMPGHSSSYFTRPNVYGFYAGLFGLLPLYVAWLKGWRWPLHIPLLLLCAAGVLSGGARGGWLMFAFGILPYLWLVFIRGSRRPLLTLLGVGTASALMLMAAIQTMPAVRERLAHSAVFLQGDYQSINQASSGRADIYTTAYHMLQAHPVNGTGADTFEQGSMPYMPPDMAWRKINNNEAAAHPHQVLLEIGAGTGWLGLAGFLVACVLLIRVIWRMPAAQRRFALPLLILPIVLWWPLNTHRSFYGSELGAMTQYLLALGLGALAVTPIMRYYRDAHDMANTLELEASQLEVSQLEESQATLSRPPAAHHTDSAS